MDRSAQKLFLSLTALSLFLITEVGFANPACYDVAVVNGYGFKDPNTQTLAILRHKVGGNTVAGIGAGGRYYGCTVPQSAIERAAKGQKKISLFFHIGPQNRQKDSTSDSNTIRGFEIDLSTEGRKVLAGRAIQVPWDVVDRSGGPTGRCTPSSPTTFEGFLYQVLRELKARRCTGAELSTLIGEPLAPQKN
ncbi:MAG: hypothetical protein J0L82_19360 [Deltaproteobacteria bacterium]|jgi:hypothetical protein|nr:hypothetical protein [Deltaproteobacteria bacterium]